MIETVERPKTPGVPPPAPAPFVVERVRWFGFGGKLWWVWQVLMGRV